jgi:hypothetical protein
MSEAILDQQDIKNQDAAQDMEDQLAKATREAEDKHSEYFALRHKVDSGFDMEKEKELWAAYKKAHNDEQAFLWAKMDEKRYSQDIQCLAKEMGIDPNDYQEDDKVPADPQEQMMEDASK